MATKTVTTSELVNATRNSDALFASEVPVATPSNLAEVGSIITRNAYLHNTFLGALWNVIALTRFQNKYYRNHFEAIKKGRLGLGESVSEIFVDRILAKTFSPNTAAVDAWKRYIPRVYNELHHINSEKLYPVTIEYKKVQQIFTDESGVDRLVNAILQRPYYDAEADDEDMILQTVVAAYNQGLIMPVKISAPTATTIEDTIVQIQSYITKMQWRNDQYNVRGVSTNTPLEDMVVLMDAEYAANYGVRVLSGAFNMEYASIPVDIIRIPQFAATTGLKILIADKEFFQVYDAIFEMGQPMKNGFGLYDSYPLHKWTIYDVSPFANAIAFTTDTVNTPTSISLGSGTSPTFTYTKGGVVDLDIKVNGTGIYDHRVNITISGNNDPTTTVIGGAIFVGVDETSSSITVTVTSLSSPTITTSTTITPAT